MRIYNIFGLQIMWVFCVSSNTYVYFVFVFFIRNKGNKIIYRCIKAFVFYLQQRNKIIFATHSFSKVVVVTMLFPSTFLACVNAYTA